MVLIPQSLRGMPASPQAVVRPAPAMPYSGDTRPAPEGDTIAISRVEVGAFTIPTEQPESDGTHEWSSTTMVTVHIHAGGRAGFGYSYAHPAAAMVIERTLAPMIRGSDPTAISSRWMQMVRAMRNDGARGIGAHAIAAIDNALWDLKARLLGIPLVTLLGSAHDSLPVYGSGGFTSLDETRLRRQIDAWVHEGIKRVKMKVGRYPEQDAARVELARRTIGDTVELYIDANGAYSRKQALRLAQDFAAAGVSLFSEPVSSDDLAGLRQIRDRAPAGMEVAAGEYGYELHDFRRLLGAVDIIQPDVTRCMGITGFLAVAALAEAASIPISAHCAPAQSLHVGCAVRPMRHLEWYFDHVRIEQLLLDGVPRLERGGVVRPDLSSPGNGLTLKKADAEQYRTAIG